MFHETSLILGYLLDGISFFTFNNGLNINSNPKSFNNIQGQKHYKGLESEFLAIFQAKENILTFFYDIVQKY